MLIRDYPCGVCVGSDILLGMLPFQIIEPHQHQLFLQSDSNVFQDPVHSV